MPVRMVLAVQDSRYVEPLLDYVQGSSFGNMLHVTAFTRMDAFLQYMTEHKPGLVVGDRDMLQAWLEAAGGDARHIAWLLLSEDGGALPSARGGEPGRGAAIAKYQPLPQLLEAVLAYCKGPLNGAVSEPKRHSGTTPVLGIASPLGGCGKSTIAMNMAKQLGVLGLRVFYLNLETANTGALFSSGTPEGEQRFSRLLYNVKAWQEENIAKRQAGAQRPEMPDVELGPFIVKHPGMKCDTFAPSQQVQELMEITEADTGLLLKLLAASDEYDLIIADTGGCIEERTLGVLEGADLLMWVLLDDLVSMYKSGVWLNYLESRHPELFRNAMGKSRYVMNRFTGQLANPLPRQASGLDGALPYIPSWKQVHQEDLLLCSPIFQREILKLCRALLEKPGLVSFHADGDRAYG
ncbi:hypothetical protein ABDI30_14840 [Paenibacillus cisolokensis]|uniref:hypothetical protein n=1 Tax=Paenibacillus cisolokensis TaxID=1658519 RepID=UPI003D2901D9